MHTLRNVIHRLDVVSATPSDTVFDVAIQMSRERVGAISIVEEDALVGIFSERDLMTRVVVAGRDPRSTPVGEVMTHEVVTADLDETVDACLEKMRRADCRHLPVVQGSGAIAMLSMRDLLRDEVEEQTEEIQTLRAHLHQSPG